MARYKIVLKLLLQDRRGVTALEYGLIASIILSAILMGFTELANGLSNQFSNIGDSLL